MYLCYLRSNNAINTASDKRRAFVAPLITASYGERWTLKRTPTSARGNAFCRAGTA